MAVDSGESKSCSGNEFFKCTYTTWYDLLASCTESRYFNNQHIYVQQDNANESNKGYLNVFNMYGVYIHMYEIS